MIRILLHVLLPMAFYTTITTILFLGMNLGALEATAVSAVLVSPVIYYFYRKDQKCRGITPAVSYKLHGCLAAILIFGAAFCILGNYLIEVFRLTEISTVYKETAKSLYSPSFPVQLLASGFLIPIIEELIFRGMVFASIRERLPFLPSAALSALLFGLYHGNLPQGVYAFLIGIFLAWLYEVCKTLLAPYLFHVSANLLSLSVTNTVLSDTLFHSKKVMAVVAAVCITLAVLCAIRIYSKNNLKEDIV